MNKGNNNLQDESTGLTAESEQLTFNTLYFYLKKELFAKLLTHSPVFISNNKNRKGRKKNLQVNNN